MWKIVEPQDTSTLSNKDTNAITRPIKSAVLILFLFCFVLGCYTFVYNGIPDSDDEQLFVSAARNMAVLGELSAGQMYGNLRLQGHYNGVEPAYPALASVLYRLVASTSLGHMQAMYLLNMVYTALTAVIIYILANQLGYTPPVAVLSALIFSFTTFVFPYSKTFYREPLAALLLIADWLCLEILLDKSKKIRLRWMSAFIFFVLAIALLLTKILLVVALPGFLLIGWAANRSTVAKWFTKKKVWLLVGLGLALLLLYIFLTLTVSDQSVLYRYSGSFIRDAWVRVINMSHNSFLSTIVGSLFSPENGFIIYSPVSLLAVISFFLDRRGGIHKFTLLLFVLAGLLIAQGLIYDNEWWTPDWGTRYLLPALPLMIIASLPAIKSTYIFFLDVSREHKKLFTRASLIPSTSLLLIIVSFCIQVGGVLISSSHYGKFIYLESGTIISSAWDLKHIPLLGHWKVIFSGQGLDLALIRVFPYFPAGVLCLIFFNGLLITYSGAALRHLILSDAHLSIFFNWQTALALLIVGITILPLDVLSTYKLDPAYYADRSDLVSACSYIKKESQPGDALIIQSYLSPPWQYFMNFDCGNIPWFSLPLQIQNDSTNNNSLLKLLNTISNHYQRLWFVAEKFYAHERASSEEEYLTQHYSIIDGQINKNSELLQVTLFSLQTSPGSTPALEK